MTYYVLQIHALSFCYNFKHSFVLFLTEGELEVLKNNKVLGKMEGGKAFGELAILYNCTRTASVRGMEEKHCIWSVSLSVAIL